MLDIQSRIEEKLLPEPMSGCLLWTGFLNDNGYGIIAIRINGKQKQRRAHRVYYELLKGPIPEGFQLDHKCRVRCCCNPEHLEPVTLIENVMRGESFYAQQARRTHCPQGHPYDGDNLFYTKKGERKCRICDRARAMRWHNNNRERSNAKRAKNQQLARQRAKQ